MESSSLTDLIEEHFYAAIPPEKRPKHLSLLTENEKHAGNDAQFKSKGKDKEARYSLGGLPVRDDDATADGEKRKYTKHPLLSAVHRAFFWRWWTAGVLKLCAG